MYYTVNYPRLHAETPSSREISLRALCRTSLLPPVLVLDTVP